MLETEVRKYLEENGAGRYHINLKSSYMFDASKELVVHMPQGRFIPLSKQVIIGYFKGELDDTSFNIQKEQSYFEVPYASVERLEKIGVFPLNLPRPIAVVKTGGYF
ncbi:hypothetical protein HYX05_02860 [Candidatus Woesearchaeota archaeon]|nr:hypothetical protein [Candidatus Woesearchaeota archaeon]